METVELGVEVRSGRGKGPARRLRVAGKAPAVFYGPNREAIAVEVQCREFMQRVSVLEGSHLIRFRSATSDLADKVSLVKDVQYHPVTGAFIHADFYEVDMAAKIQVRVPLHFTGKAAGIVMGGILQPVRRDVEVECLPGDIPEFINVDVTPLGIHDAVHVSQLVVPAGVDVLYDDDFAVVTVLAPVVEEAKGAEAAADGAAAPAEAAKAPKTEEKKG